MDISFGKLDTLINNEDIVRIYVNNHDEIWSEAKNGGISKSTVNFSSDEDINKLANRIVTCYGHSNSSEKVMLIKINEEFWVHLVFPPISIKGIIITIIKERLEGEDIIALTV